MITPLDDPPPGLSFQVDEPFQRLSAGFDGVVHLLDDPAVLADPGRALTAAPEAHCRIRLDVRASAAPHEQTFDSDVLPSRRTTMSSSRRSTG